MALYWLELRLESFYILGPNIRPANIYNFIFLSKIKGTGNSVNMLLPCKMQAEDHNVFKRNVILCIL